MEATLAHVSMDQSLDKSLRAAQPRFTGGLSPIALAAAYSDWVLHLSSAPGKQLELIAKAGDKTRRFTNYAALCAPKPDASEPCITPLPQDKRFTDEEWHKWPFNAMSQAFLLNQQWWHNATTGVAGVTSQHEDVVTFTARQMLDFFSPSNFALTNPEVLAKTANQGGMNLMRGWQNLLEDISRTNAGKKPIGAEAFEVGRNTAIAPGKVVFRNHLIELIQYAPTTNKVRLEPILIVPAWIMKYYILDLEEQNSLVRHLTAQGFTVFMVSWKNPDADGRDLGMDDYLSLGVMDGVDAVHSITGDPKIHAVVYCLGGTLLSIAAAMARGGDTRLQSLTLLAAQVDFTEAGELTLFINDSQLAFLEDMMWEKGYLDTKQMAGAFQLLRSNDLIWSGVIHDYHMGERSKVNALMALKADAVPDAFRVPAASVLEERSGGGALRGWRQAHRDLGHSSAGVRGGGRARSCGTMAIGIHIQLAVRHRCNVRSDQRRGSSRNRGIPTGTTGCTPKPRMRPTRIQTAGWLRLRLPAGRGGRPLTEAPINIFPDLTTKRDIVQNEIDLAHALGTQLPKAALPSAVETVASNIPSTLDAAALCKMADPGQITGGMLDGPRAFDNAVSRSAADAKGHPIPGCGRC